MHRLVAASLGLLLLSPVAADVRAYERVVAYGIVERGEDVYLFSNVYPCGEGQESIPPGIAQMMVSQDGGASWQAIGPALDGHEFSLYLEHEGRLLIAGQHTREGPAIDPFVLIEEGNSWTQHTIYNDASELERLAVARDGNLVAWVRHLTMREYGWDGPVYIHSSVDDGRTWQEIGKEEEDFDVEVALEFAPLSRETESHRIVETGDLVTLVERRSEQGWEVVSEFRPQPCVAPAAE